MRSTILHIHLATPEPPRHDKIGANSWFLRSCASFQDRIVLAFGAPGTRKDESLGRLCADLKPLEDNRFEIELAVILTERLPSPKETPEYTIKLANTNALDGIFCISNVMQIIRYKHGEIDCHAVCQAVATQDFLVKNRDKFPAAPHIEYLPSVVTARYNINGKDAEDALSAHLEPVIDDFVASINQILTAHIMSIDTQKLKILTPVYDWGSFPWIYLLVRGADGQFRNERVATNLLRTTLVALSYDDAGWEQFLAYTSGEVEFNVPMRALRMSESYIQAGAYDFALLLLAIAAEIATTRFVHDRLQKEGVSKKKLKDIDKDLTFSIMLNTQVMALAPAHRKPDLNLIGEIDRIRKRRNDLMHKGNFAVQRTEVTDMINIMQRYLDYLNNASAV